MEETAEELLAKQHRKEKKELQGGRVFLFLLFTSNDFLEVIMYLFIHFNNSFRMVRKQNSK